MWSPRFLLGIAERVAVLACRWSFLWPDWEKVLYGSVRKRVRFFGHQEKSFSLDLTGFCDVFSLAKDRLFSWDPSLQITIRLRVAILHAISFASFAVAQYSFSSSQEKVKSNLFLIKLLVDRLDFSIFCSSLPTWTLWPFFRTRKTFPSLNFPPNHGNQIINHLLFTFYRLCFSSPHTF